MRFLFLRRGSFDVLFQIWVFLLGEGDGGWACFTVIRNRSCVKKFDFTEKSMQTLSTGGFCEIRFPTSTFLYKSIACFAIFSCVVFLNDVFGRRLAQNLGGLIFGFCAKFCHIRFAYRYPAFFRFLYRLFYIFVFQ